MDRRFVVLVAVFVAACSKGDASSGASARTRDSAGGTVDTRVASESGTSTAPASSEGLAATAGNAAANLQGRIPVLEYHVISGDKNSLYTRTAASYRADMEEAYKRGYRPITIAQMLDKDFRDVPAGMSPVVFVFDDASDSQFRYLENNGALTIDPTSAVGIWLDFAKTHPGWKNRGTFCMLNGGAAGHNFFGDGPKYGGQKKAWRFQKVKWLADQGFEL